MLMYLKHWATLSLTRETQSLTIHWFFWHDVSDGPSRVQHENCSISQPISVDLRDDVAGRGGASGGEAGGVASLTLQQTTILDHHGVTGSRLEMQAGPSKIYD